LVRNRRRKRGEAKVGEKAEGRIGGKVYEPMKKRRGEKRFGGRE